LYPTFEVWAWCRSFPMPEAWLATGSPELQIGGACYPPGMRASSSAIAVAVVIASVTSAVGLYVLINSRVTNELLAIASAAVVVLLPVAVLVWTFSDRSKVKPAADGRKSPWLDVAGDDEAGYVLIGDPAALEALGSECLRLARTGQPGEEASFDLEDVEVASVVRQDVPPVPPPQSWKDKAAAAGCLAVVLIAVAIWVRGCVAIQNDVQRWLN
jgi:hypothetical protein